MTLITVYWEYKYKIKLTSRKCICWN